MKGFIKENSIRLLLLLLLGLLFVLWGRIIVREVRLNMHTRNLTSTAARLACLESYGWEGDPSSETVQNAVIPDPLDAVYKQYNKLQTPCGFNLERYRGETVQSYSYIVNNFPYETGEPVYVHLLILEGELIGGDCMSRALDGFMLPLDRRFLP